MNSTCDLPEQQAPTSVHNTPQIVGETVEIVADFIFLSSKITAEGDCSHEIKRRLLLGRKVMTNLDSILKSRDITLPTKVRLVKAMVFAVVMYGCESWTTKKEPKNWCFWTVVLEKTLASPLDCKEIHPVHPKGDQSWVFIGRTDVEAETPILRPPDAKSWLIWKDPDAGKDWGQEEKGKTEDEMVGWHHWLDGHGFGWTPGVGDEQGGLACCGSWGRKQPDTTERLNWTEYPTTDVKLHSALLPDSATRRQHRRRGPWSSKGKQACELNNIQLFSFPSSFWDHILNYFPQIVSC